MIVFGDEIVPAFLIFNLKVSPKSLTQDVPSEESGFNSEKG
jgi:hypothetical protein